MLLAAAAQLNKLNVQIPENLLDTLIAILTTILVEDFRISSSGVAIWPLTTLPKSHYPPASS
jgi:hypothetical protein